MRLRVSAHSFALLATTVSAIAIIIVIGIVVFQEYRAFDDNPCDDQVTTVEGCSEHTEQEMRLMARFGDAAINRLVAEIGQSIQLPVRLDCCSETKVEAKFEIKEYHKDYKKLGRVGFELIPKPRAFIITVNSLTVRVEQCVIPPGWLTCEIRSETFDLLAIARENNVTVPEILLPRSTNFTPEVLYGGEAEMRKRLETPEIPLYLVKHSTGCHLIHRRGFADPSRCPHCQTTPPDPVGTEL